MLPATDKNVGGIPRVERWQGYVIGMTGQSGFAALNRSL